MIMGAPVKQFYRQIHEIELSYEESHDEGGPKFNNFDCITKRYLDYCQHRGLDIEDFIPGLKNEENEQSFI